MSVDSDSEIEMEFGRAVNDQREIRFLSVSQIKMFDPALEFGCPRRWHLNKVERIKYEEDTTATKTGKTWAKDLENYLKTGVDMLPPELRAGKHLLPKPGPDLEVEKDLGVVLRETVPVLIDGAPVIVDGKFKTKEIRYQPALRKRDELLKRGEDDMFLQLEIEELAGLVADGIPVVGAPDVRHFRNWYVDNDCIMKPERDGDVVCETQDHKNTSRIHDHTTRGGKFLPGYAKSVDDILYDTQMVGYGEHGANRRPEITHARLTHNYFQRANGYCSDKRTGLLTVEEVRQRWKVRGHDVARQMRQVAKITVRSEVPYHETACRAYNRDCPYLGKECVRPQSIGFVKLSGMMPKREGAEAMEDIFSQLGLRHEAAAEVPAAATVGVDFAKRVGVSYGDCGDCGEALTAVNASRLPDGQTVKHIGCPKTAAPRVHGGINPADGPPADPVAASDALPPEVRQSIQDKALRERAELHAKEVAEREAANAKPGETKMSSKCPGGGVRVKLSQEQAGTKKYACEACGKVVGIKPSADFTEATLPGHMRPKAEGAAPQTSQAPPPPPPPAQSAPSQTEGYMAVINNAASPPPPAPPVQASPPPPPPAPSEQPPSPPVAGPPVIVNVNGAAKSGSNGVKHEIGIGSVVILKSGGPRMTVEDVADLAVCVWFHDGDLKRAKFPAALLKEVAE